jgi:hypothetical protein
VQEARYFSGWRRKARQKDASATARPDFSTAIVVMARILVAICLLIGLCHRRAMKRRFVVQEMGMNIASAFADLSKDEIKALLDGGALVLHSITRPMSADHPVARSAVLATFKFATPAFGPDDGEFDIPNFEANPVDTAHLGVPCFARALKADGTVVADFSAGPGDREIKLAETSCTPNYPSKIVSLKIKPVGDWPERPDYFFSKPKPGYAMPKVP